MRVCAVNDVLRFDLTARRRDSVCRGGDLLNGSDGCERVDVKIGI